MDIEEDDDNLNDNDPKIYNKIIKNFSQFTSLFDNITLQSFVELFHIKGNSSNLISLFSDTNLEECVKTIKKNNIHRLIVQDRKSNNLSGFITYETIFEYFIENYYSSMNEFKISLKNLDIIVKNIITLNKKESLHKGMETFYKEGISMIPITDDDGDIFGYFYLKDIIYFFSTGEKFNFNITIEDFLKDLYEDVDQETPYGKTRIVEVQESSDLKYVFEQMSISPERKLIIRKNSKIGVVALYDIFKKLII